MNAVRLKVEIRVSVWSGEDLDQYDGQSFGTKLHRPADAASLTTAGRHSQLPAKLGRDYVRDHLRSMLTDAGSAIPSFIDDELRKKGFK